MLPTGTHPATAPSDGRASEVGTNGSTTATMSGSSIDNRITMMEQMIQNPRSTPSLSLPISTQPPANRFNRTGSGGMGGPNRPSLGLNLPIVSGTRRSESELKFQKIVDKSGLLKINDKIYRTQLSDLEDLGELGNGTSGHVVKMRHNPSGAIIAVKQMRRTGNDEENKRIIMDLDVVLKSENCKYIVKCLGCFITDADVWICMELMTTCFDKLQKKSKKPVPEEILGKVTVATVRALAYLKDNHRVIHRDVKPSNILIDDRGNIKLCDFGISGRLVDSNARTRSAGCAAYMAPERIDPAKTVYDIRADVWSLGITLVELATGVFPYRGCVTDFEVLTQVLTSNPPRLPEDQNFSPEFRDFVQLCLQKDYQARPKYPDLLRHAFLQRAEHDTTINVGEWFRNVAVNCGIQLTSTPPPPTAGSSASVSSPPTWTASSEQTRIPTPLGSLTEAVQAQSNQQKQTIAIAASSIPIKSTATILSPHIANEAPSNLSDLQQRSQHELNQQQQLLQSKLSNISLASSSSSTSAAAAAAAAAAGSTPVPASSYTPTSSSSAAGAGAFDTRRSPSPQAYYLAKMQPKSAITSTSVPIASGGGPAFERNGSLEPARKYKHSPFLSRRTASEYGNGSPKKESTLSSLGQSIFKNLTTSPFAQRKSLPPGESKLVYPPPVSPSPMPVASATIYANGGGGGGAGAGCMGSNPSSPLLLLRKAHHDGSDTETQYKHLHGNTSPIVLQRFYHQQNQLKEQQREALQQHHHHQQHQQQQQQQQHQQQQQQVIYGYSSPSPIPSASEASPRPTRYSPLPSHRTVHHGVHPVQSNTGGTTTLHQSAIPLYKHHEPAAPLAPSQPSGIPVYQQQTTASPKHKSSSFFNTFSRGMKSGGRGDKVIDRGGTAAPPTMMSGAADRSLYAGTTATNTTHQTALYHHQQGQPNTSSMLHRHGALGGISNGGGGVGAGLAMPEGSKEDADIKRKFASFVKLNLSNNVTGASGTGTTTTGDRLTLKEKHLQQQQLLQQQQQFLLQQQQQQQHYAPSNPFDGMPAGGMGGMYGAGPYPTGGSSATSIVQPPSAIPQLAHVLNSPATDRRHRSPDPPPRLNRGQSPLLLQRKLEQLGHTGSPLMNRRPFNSTSPSPPLPPRRASESAPGSPQHLRARINYTPEPHRRPYHTTIEQ
ncbi:dual specificity mitogen-activated protein kinase kinase hemipterous-like isoform X2 [Anopheles merus]|uniref:dual specificity mitogen-activated protein kinase kinase hemipterous-like isoform X2 n=1 Tax=Anopheles merus TaxID=30066 RepID=UPI001BE4C5A4|nr:dual specificity mitogen-activated protein kinase kinase hemipterous-like isoform X2 [Anopheles merus]